MILAERIFFRRCSYAIRPNNPIKKSTTPAIEKSSAGFICYLAARLRDRLDLDDALDVWAVHGVGGTWGAFATGLFATGAITTVTGFHGGVGGAIDGRPEQLLAQLAGIGATWGYSFVMTFGILKVLDWLMAVRVSPREELVGIDLAQHGERAYGSW